MAPFSIPAPSIIPLCLPSFGRSKSIDTNIKVQLLCETYLEHEIFFTLDGTKPEPYAGIVQGSKLIKYCSPFCLPPGKITIKAIAINKNVHTMRSSVVTKNFVVIKADSLNNIKQDVKVKQTKKPKLKKKNNSIENEKNASEMMNVQDEQKSDAEVNRFNPNSMKDEDILNCFDQAFIGDSEFDSDNSVLEESIEDECSFAVNNNESVTAVLGKLDVNCDDELEINESDSICETVEEVLIHENNMGEPNVTLATDTAVSADTQFCCLKCDLTLQQCISCNKMNGVSSKFCIGCGKQLSRICSICSEYNPGVATFCQYCGNKLSSKSIKREPLIRIDHSIMAKPESKDAANQTLPAVTARSTQTINNKSPVKKNPDLKRIPHHSPGRGYWHQQLDYICNNLKSHAYNNVEFRKEISEPMLCGFKSAHIMKEENSITVTVVFSPIKDKNNLGASDEIKSKHEEGEDA